jgi:glucosylceramidase
MHGFLGKRPRAAMALVRVALLAGFVAGCSPNASATPAITPSPSTAPPIPVKVWVTTADETLLLSAQPDLAFSQTAATPPDTTGKTVVEVDENNQYQQMDGFGAAMTDSSAWLIYTQMPAAQRQDLMSKLFSRTDGIGTSMIRVPMGASDLVHGPAYTYDDMPTGKTDPTLAHFSIEHDMAYIIPALKDALKLNPDLKIFANPWSPPAWMKTTDRLGDGTLLPQYRAAWAQYFVKFIQAYQAQGVPIWAITMQNEPGYEPGSYPGMRIDAPDEATLARDFMAPALKAAGLDTKIMVWDHNWDNYAYPETVFADPAAKAVVAGTAWHCYAGNYMDQGFVHDAYPDMPMWETECSSFTTLGFGEGFKADMSDLTVGSIRYWSRSVVKWPFATNTTNGPNTGGCGTCLGFVTVDPSAPAGYTFTRDYYSVGQVSKFVLPGAYRVASSGFQYHGFETVAFKNPDGSKALVVSNPDNFDNPIVVTWGDRTFEYKVPAQSAATFVWSGDQSNPSKPAPPQNMTYKFDTGKMDLKWDFSPLADTYVVKRSDIAGGPYKVLASGVGLPEYFDSSAKSGTTYYYVVSAVNGHGESADSPEATAVPAI